MRVALASIIESLGGELHGGEGLAISGLASLDSAGPGELSFLSNPKYRSQLAASKAGCVIVSPQMAEVAQARGACIVAENPYLYFARVTRFWKEASSRKLLPQLHASAVVSPSAQIHPSAYIGPLCVVEDGARIGADSVLKSRVTVGEGCSVGERCIVHSGVVIGADGFGFAPNGEVWEKIEQLGAVRIGNDVEIGANTCIDRGALQDTIIEDGVKLDNLIQIGHNVRVGRNTAMAGCVGVAGSATIGPNCTLGGGAIVLGHLTLAAGVHISAATVVSKSILKAGHYTGMFPIDDNAAWERNAATLKQLHSLRDRIKILEKEDKA
jgi:UDP-3-O-[3-hydroxymyristoyl] glucosamine N-acyltransferase